MSVFKRADDLDRAGSTDECVVVLAVVAVIYVCPPHENVAQEDSEVIQCRWEFFRRDEAVWRARP